MGKKGLEQERVLITFIVIEFVFIGIGRNRLFVCEHAKKCVRVRVVLVSRIVREIGGRDSKKMSFNGSRKFSFFSPFSFIMLFDHPSFDLFVELWR